MTTNGTQNPPTNGYNPLDLEVEKKLDPAFVKYYNEVINFKPATHQVPLKNVRANPERYAGPWVTPVPETERIRSRNIPSKDGYEIPVRIYHPDCAVSGEGPYGLHLNYHGKRDPKLKILVLTCTTGGGFVFGGLGPDAKFCANISEKVGLVVIDVNYRHCPGKIEVRDEGNGAY
jgi:acetyl esterase/lipase